MDQARLHASTTGRFSRRGVRGFTLIELMVVLVIVGVLAAVALPSFLEQVRRSRRAEAITELYRVAQAQERFRASSPTYSTILGISGTSGLNLTSTANATSYSMPSGYYSIAIVAANATRYQLTATAAGAMSGDASCSRLEIDMGDPGTSASPNPPGTMFFRSFPSGTNPAANGTGANARCWNR